jgi:asparagine synthase (glutamine-hydrolysing)
MSNVRTVLETVIREALVHPPCGVAFSGGRDSSTLLALAAHVARRDGLPEPIPITKVFPRVAEANEGDWQELVVRHVGLKDWQRVIIHDELDLVGPVAGAQLLEHGVLWPPTVHGDTPMVEQLQGGTLIDGEGGDEVFGVNAHRIAPVTRFVHSPRPLRSQRVIAAARALAPAKMRARYARRHYENLRITWLRPPARDALEDCLATTERDRPLSFASSVLRIPVRRTQAALARNRRKLASRRNVRVWSPLLHPDVVHAIARDGRTMGRTGRTAALRVLASDLLPDAVLSRTSKAMFNGVIMSRYTSEFAQRWTGKGVDPDLVDVDELSRLWRSGERHALTSALLQAAWLESVQRAPLDSVH